MSNLRKYLAPLSGNMLKLLACIFMLIDHVGMIFFPTDMLYRTIGRLAFPIFAFMIAEGAKYTRKKIRYFLTVAIIAVGMEAVYYLLFKSLVLSIFVTFSFSIITIYAMQLLKKVIFADKHSLFVTMLAAVPLAAAIALTYFVSRKYAFDYGFAGAMVPVLASLFRMPECAPDWAKRLDNHLVHLLMTTAGLAVLASQGHEIQRYSLLAIPLLLLYSGKRGKRKLKYFFYVFYPAHICILYLIYMIIRNL